MFHVGQKVVCIADAFSLGFLGEVFPVKGAVYTIRDIVTDGDGAGLRLEEIVNKPCRYLLDNGDAVHDEPCFCATAFRPVTDIGWAHEIVAEVLNKQPVRA